MDRLFSKPNEEDSNPYLNNHNGCYPKGLIMFVVARVLVNISLMGKPPQVFCERVSL